MEEKFVMQVDEKDKEIDPLDIIKAHTDISLVHRGLTFALRDLNDNILFQRRSQRKDTFKLHWDMGGSTHQYYDSEAGSYESNEKAIKRGIKNELRIDPSFIRQIIYKGKFRYFGRDPFSSYIESEWDWVFDVTLNDTFSSIGFDYNKDEVEEVLIVPLGEAYLRIRKLSPLAPWTGKAFQVYKKATKIK